eukprot:gene61882-biopygen31491
MCNAGYTSTVSGSSSCSPCDPGYFSSSVGSTACESVPPGHFANSLGSTRYQICEQGTYNGATAQAECRVCPPGTVTARFGSTFSGDCVSPRINFIAAYVCIVVAAVMSTVYIVFARFDRLSFDRQEKFIRPAVERMKAFTQILDADIAKLLADRMKQLSEVSLSSTTKVCIFSIVVAVIVLGSAVSLFVSILRKVFLNLLIGWKGM